MTRRHGTALRTILLTEALERFAFVGMQSLPVLYFVKSLAQPGRIEAGWPLAPLANTLGLSGQPLAAAIVGGFSALIYLALVGGGIITDRWLGQRRAVLLGGGLQAAGYFLLALAPAWLPGLLLLVAGTGFYKGSIVAQVGELHAPDDPRRADAFQLFFLVVALVSIAAPLLIGSLGERLSWSAGFVASGIAMVGSVVIYGRAKAVQPEAFAPQSPPADDIGVNERRRIAAVLLLLPLIVQPNFQMSNAYLVWGDRSFTRFTGMSPADFWWLHAAITLAATLGFVLIRLLLWPSARS